MSKTRVAKEEQEPLLEEAPKFEWLVEERPVAYDRALAFMEAKVRTIRDRHTAEIVWLIEHPPVYTGGTSANPKDLINPRFPVFYTGRGGQFTYHGPGQRVGYVMIDLQERKMDLQKYVHSLEEWVIRALAKLDVKGERRKGRVGIWVDLKPYGGKGEAKIAALGVRVRKWVTFHGVSINVKPDLSHYDGIVPCGITEHGVTSLAQLGKTVPMAELDAALRSSWEDVFGPVQ